MRLKWFVLLGIFLMHLNCNTDGQNASASASAIDKVKAVSVSGPELDEISGLVASRTFPGILWVHNDSGDEARIFAIDSSGRTVGQVLLKGVRAVDWEDIALGPGPKAHTSYLYIGDIGDNRARRDFKVIYRLPEPDVVRLRAKRHGSVNHFATIRFRLPDGPRDSETLMCDPLTKDLYVVSKRENRVRLYRLPFPQDTSRIVNAEFLHELALTQITAGDISPSGRHIILKNYLQIFYFPRTKGQSVARALEGFPSFLPYTEEPQGEALGFKPDETGYYTMSEAPNHQPTTMYFYPYRFTNP